MNWISDPLEGPLDELEPGAEVYLDNHTQAKVVMRVPQVIVHSGRNTSWYVIQRSGLTYEDIVERERLALITPEDAERLEERRRLRQVVERFRNTLWDAIERELDDIPTAPCNAASLRKQLVSFRVHGAQAIERVTDVVLAQLPSPTVTSTVTPTEEHSNAKDTLDYFFD